jgi:hypothetical protein
MRLDLDLTVGEELRDDAGQQRVVGFLDLDGGGRLEPRFARSGSRDAP